MPDAEHFRTEKNGKRLPASDSCVHARGMFSNFQKPDPNSKPREILAWNKSAIFDRIDNGVSMMTVHEKLCLFLDQQEGDYAPVVYQTFRRFVNREKAKNRTQPPAVSKAKETPPPSSSTPAKTSSQSPAESDATLPPPGFDKNGFPIRDTSKRPSDGIFDVPPLRPEDF